MGCGSFAFAFPFLRGRLVALSFAFLCRGGFEGSLGCLGGGLGIRVAVLGWEAGEASTWRVGVMLSITMGLLGMLLAAVMWGLSAVG